MSRKSPKGGLKPVKLTMSKGTTKKIAALREEMGVESDSEVVRRAIRIYERLLRDARG
jgi:hypothetical protein